jgi:hypothetical protein
MRHHLITPDVACPRCGKLGLVFMRTTQTADVYACSGCLHTAFHQSIARRTKGCGIRAVLAGAQLGPIRPCRVAEEKLAPKGN